MQRESGAIDFLSLSDLAGAEQEYVRFQGHRFLNVKAKLDLTQTHLTHFTLSKHLHQTWELKLHIDSDGARLLVLLRHFCSDLAENTRRVQGELHLGVATWRQGHVECEQYVSFKIVFDDLALFILGLYIDFLAFFPRQHLSAAKASAGSFRCTCGKHRLHLRGVLYFWYVWIWKDLERFLESIIFFQVFPGIIFEGPWGFLQIKHLSDLGHPRPCNSDRYDSAT